MKIKTQLLLAFCTIAIIVPIYSLINYRYLSFIQSTIYTIINSDTKIIDSTADISYYLADIDDVIADYLSKSVERVKTINLIEKNKNRIKQSMNIWRNAIHLELDNPETSPDLVNMLQQRLTNHNKAHQELDNIFNLISTFLAKPLSSHSYAQYNDLREVEDVIQEIIFNERNTYENDIQTDQSEIYNSIKQTKLIGTFLFIFAFAVAFFLSARIARSLTKRLNLLNQTAESISNGDYSITLKDTSQDELGTLSRLFSKMALSICKSQKYIENIIQTMPNIFILTTSDFKILRVNHAAKNQLGYTEDELLKMNFVMLVEHEQEIDVDNKKVLESYKTKMLCKDGKKITVIMSSSYLINGHTEIIYIAQDVSLLQTKEERMLIAAREAGMSEIANSVLHNVGNVLNSVNASIVIIQEKITDSKLENLTKLSVIMQEHKDDIVNFLTHSFSTQNLPKYLLLLSESWKENKDLINQELAYLKSNLNHVNDIIHAQQELNILAPLVQEISIVEICNDVLALHKTAFDQASIDTVCNFSPIKKIMIDKVKIMQILINLVKNSIDSLLESNNSYKRLELVVKEKNETHFIIEISDNGLGILSDNILKIFTYGFTTKIKGHGFGLHSCANNAKEMGGLLHVTSDGLGKGATFILELPYQPRVKI